MTRTDDQLRSGRFDAAPVIRRRAALAVGAAGVLGAALLPLPPAHTPVQTRPVDLRARWTEILTAQSQLGHPSQRVRESIEKRDERVAQLLDRAARAEDGELFRGIPMIGTDEPRDLTRTATRLQEIAVAWATPGSRWAASARLVDVVADGLDQFAKAGYRDGAVPFGSWFQWEIGIPRPLADVTCILRDHLDPGQVTRVLDAVDHFIPDPRRSRISDYPSTGANRVNTTRAALIAAVVREDVGRIAECVEALQESWGDPIRRDGFYPDGGFIQHVTVAYNGSYGVEWLLDVAPLLRLLQGSGHEPENVERVWALIDDSFLPFMITGHMADAVRGRAVSRLGQPGSVIGARALAAVAQLQQVAPSTAGDRWLATIRDWASRNRSLDLLAGEDAASAAALDRARGVQGAPVPSASRYVPSIDRLLHRGAGWSAMIAMSSSRIAAYEGSDEENVWGGRTGNAMRYLYLGDDPLPFDEDYWATVDYESLPGTTNHRVPLVAGLTGEDGAKEPANEWAGGVVAGPVSVAAFHQTGLADDAPHCRKLTVGTPHRLIELVADVESTHGPVTTTVEHRPLMAKQGPRITVDGHLSSRPVSDARIAHIPGVGGYVFLVPGEVAASVRQREGSSQEAVRDVTEVPAEDRVSRTWATIWITHAKHGGAWMILPGAGAEQTVQAARAPERGSDGVVVVRNDETAQAIAVGETTTVVAAWASGRVLTPRGLAVDLEQAAVVIVDEGEDTVTVTVSEPTQAKDRLALSLSGLWTVESGDGSSTPDGDTTRIWFDARDAGGQRMTVTLSRA